MVKIRTGQIGQTGDNWQSWTPTFTLMSGGTLNYAKFEQVGKTVRYRFMYTLAGAGISGNPTFTFPVQAHADYVIQVDTLMGTAVFVKSGTQSYIGDVRPTSTTVGILRLWQASGTSIINTGAISSTVPFTWAAADYMLVSGEYEAA